VVNILNDPASLELLKQARYPVIAATPNWLATPFQVD